MDEHFFMPDISMQPQSQYPQQQQNQYQLQQSRQGQSTISPLYSHGTVCVLASSRALIHFQQDQPARNWASLTHEQLLACGNMAYMDLATKYTVLLEKSSRCVILTPPFSSFE